MAASALDKTFGFLSKTDGEAAVELLRVGLDVPQPAVRRCALRALLRRRGGSAVQEVLRRLPTLTDADAPVICEQADRFGRMMGEVLRAGRARRRRGCVPGGRQVPRLQRRAGAAVGRANCRRAAADALRPHAAGTGRVLLRGTAHARKPAGTRRPRGPAHGDRRAVRADGPQVPRTPADRCRRGVLHPGDAEARRAAADSRRQPRRNLSGDHRAAASEQPRRHPASGDGAAGRPLAAAAGRRDRRRSATTSASWNSCCPRWGRGVGRPCATRCGTCGRSCGRNRGIRCWPNWTARSSGRP